MQHLCRLAIAGASGRMGQQLLQAASASQGVTLAGALVRENSSLINADAGELAGIGTIGVTLQAAGQTPASAFDVLIDFTRPDHSLALLALCQAQQKAVVIGTTGFSETQKATIRAASAHIPVVLSANFSIGVNVLLTLLEKTSQILDENCDIEIIEAHHRHKIDAPSGTALAMGETIARSRGTSLAQCAVYARQGITDERKSGQIGFASVRAGDIVGEHTALFALAGERLEISHKASSRLTFAHGAIRAARWLHGQPPGLYSMAHVLGL